MTERTISDAEAIEKIAARYESSGQDEIFDDSSSLIEFIGDTIEQTGRQAWFEEPGYLAVAVDGTGRHTMDTEITNQLSIRYKQMRAMEHLTGAADLTSHILTRIAGGGSSNGPSVQGGDKATIPINDTAVDDANALYVLLLKWSMGHSRALHVAPPAIALGWSRLEEQPNGFPSWATPVDAHVLVASVVDWLMAWDETIATLSQASIYWDDLDEQLRKIRKRWMPEAPKVKVFASRDCPICAKRRTVIVDIDEEANDVTVACTFCGYVVPNDYRKKYLEWKLEEATSA